MRCCEVGDADKVGVGDADNFQLGDADRVGLGDADENKSGARACENHSQLGYAYKEKHPLNQQAAGLLVQGVFPSWKTVPGKPASKLRLEEGGVRHRLPTFFYLHLTNPATSASSTMIGAGTFFVSKRTIVTADTSKLSS